MKEMDFCLILGIIGFVIAFAAVIIGAILEIKHKRRYEWIISLSILGVGLGMIGILGSMITGAEERIIDAIRASTPSP